MKVTVRCGCQTLKKEWSCQDVQAAYRNASSDPKEIPKNQYALGLLPCKSECKSKAKVADTGLHLRKSKALEVISLGITLSLFVQFKFSVFFIAIMEEDLYKCQRIF